MYSLRQLIPVLNALLVFEEAGDQNSFTRAGRNLGMSQPSVSRFITNLEQHLGTQLFERQHNRLRLTQAGERLHHSVANGLLEIRQACSEVEAKSETPTLNIECTHGFAYMWLVPRMQSLVGLLPGWEINTINTERGNRIASGQADLVIRIGNGDWPGQQSVLLFEEEVFPVCSSEFLQQHDLADRLIKPDELIQLPLVYEDLGDREWMDWREWFSCFGLKYNFPNDARPLFNYALVLQAAMEGKGLALAWEQLAEPYLANGWLVAMSNMRVKTGLGYYLCFSPGSSIGEVIQRWCESLDEGIGR
ncbi:MAG: LysR family glycine cleavage system transcriptional activator [Gammaproteobacteria bacterium]|jgi:LysR family glycine cleavage system transcriptional activator